MRKSILSTNLDVVRRKTAANCIQWNNSVFVSGSLVSEESRSKRHRDER